jgi:hypothetical protein
MCCLQICRINHLDRRFRKLAGLESGADRLRTGEFEISEADCAVYGSSVVRFSGFNAQDWVGLRNTGFVGLTTTERTAWRI